MPQITPGSEYFAGRDATLARLLEAFRRESATLLYGGRQAGKTSVLLACATRMRATIGRVSDIAVLDVPVYVDLTTLHYDATPPELFGLLATKLRDALSQQIVGFAAPDEAAKLSLDGFVRALAFFRERCGEVDAKPVFFLDEAKRVLGSRFPRGFQDNLFALLYGELAPDARCSMVFAGAQHLNDFSKD